MALPRSASSIDLRPFETVDPRMEEIHEAGVFTLRIYLPGFKKEQLKVQLSSSGMLKVSGERPPQPGGSSQRWTRFKKDLPVPQGCNLDEIRAKFSDGVLNVTVPKLQQAAPAEEPAAEKQREPSPQQAPQQRKPSPPPKPEEPQKPVTQSPAELGEDKGKNGTGEEDQKSAVVPGSSKDLDSTAGAGGLRRRRSFVPRVNYSGLSTRKRLAGIKAVGALLLLLAALWFSYIYWGTNRDGTARTSLAPYYHYHHGDGL